jgi:hypothetical protein
MGRGGRGSFVRYIVHGSRIGLDAPRKSGALYHRSLASNMARGDKFRETLTRRFGEGVGGEPAVGYGLKLGGIGGSSRISVMVTRRLAAM